MKILIFILLISHFTFAQVGVYKVEKITDGAREVGVKHLSFNEVIRRIEYTQFDKGLATKARVFDVFEGISTLIGTREYIYHNNKVILAIQKDLKNNISTISWFYEKNDELFEEVRDSRNNILRYYLHNEDSFQDVTRRILTESSLDKLVIIENDIIKALRPLESLKDILNSNEELSVAQSLRTIDLAFADRRESLGTQLVTDAIKSYTGAQVVIMPALAFRGRIDIGRVSYKDLKGIIAEEELFLVTMTGRKILALLENMLALPSRHREYFHTAGLTWEQGRDSKLSVARIEGSAVDPRRNYTIVVPKYIKDGNGIFYEFANEKAFTIPYSTSIVVADYLRDIRLIDDSYRVENRQGL